MHPAESLCSFGATQFLRRLGTRRRGNAIIELAALADVLPSIAQHSDELRRFTANYQLAKHLDGNALGHVMGSPYGLVWLRRTFECLGVLRGEATVDVIKPHMRPEQSIEAYRRELLDQFGFLVAATLIQFGQTAALPEPTPLRRPTTLAATTWHLVPDGDVGLFTGVAKGMPEGRGFEVVHLGSVTVRDRQIVIDPLDDFLASETREGASRDIGRRHATAFREALLSALDLFQTGCPDVIDEIALSYFAVTPSLINCPTGFPSGTTSTSVGLSAFSVPSSPAILCEMLVHELSHGQLFSYQDVDPILDPAAHGEGWLPENLYSPWRDDARPANGLLHAVFVFSRVAAMWLSFIRSGTADADLACRRLAALRYQLRIGVGLLQEVVKWTASGQIFWKALQCSVDQIHHACAALNLDQVQPQYAEVASLGRSQGTAKERQREHLRRWRERNPNDCTIAEHLLELSLAS